MEYQYQQNAHKYVIYTCVHFVGTVIVDRFLRRNITSEFIRIPTQNLYDILIRSNSFIYFMLVTEYHCRRLWAEVFHVSASGAGTVKWQQVSEDLVPVNITCIQDSPECVFHITAYNSQVDKILDVRLVQPGNSFQHPSHSSKSGYLRHNNIHSPGFKW